MVNAQEYINQKYPQEEREFIKKLDISRLELEGELDLREFVNLEYLDIEPNNLTSLDLSKCSKLVEFRACNNPLTKIVYPNNNPQEWVWKTWTKIRDSREPQIPGLAQLVDTSDLDNWVKNYAFDKIGDKEYHKFCGGNGKYKEFNCLDYTTLDNLDNKLIARNLIILSRLLTSKKDLEAGKNKLYEEKMNELANGFQKCYAMLPGKPWSKEEQKKAINKALSGDQELLSRIKDLPYAKIPTAEEIENWKNEPKKYTYTSLLDEKDKKIKELEKQVKELEEKLKNTTIKLNKILTENNNYDDLKKAITELIRSGEQNLVENDMEGEKNTQPLETEITQQLEELTIQSETEQDIETEDKILITPYIIK
jgi:hypothetical protein